jgi:hypothetical protein
MRDTLPDMRYVQTRLPALAGHVGVGVEGSNATVQGDDIWHANSGNDLTVPPMDPYGPITRYFDVFSRGTNSCTWSASPWQPWVKLSQYNGTVGSSGGDSRVYIYIDWANAPAGPNSTQVNINVTTPCRGLDKYGFREPKVVVPVNVRTVPSSFTKGFVESDGHVSIEAAHYDAIVPATTTSANSSNVTYHEFKNYGRTMSGIGLYPPDTEKLAVGEGPALDYQMYLFSNGTANVTLYISPAANHLGDFNPLQYAIALFPAGQTPPSPTIVRPISNTVGTQMPQGWGFAVADAVWGLNGNYTTSSFNVTREGAYTLRIWALLPNIVIQKVVVNLGGVRKSYLGPPESFLMGRDKQGEYNQTSFINSPGILGGVGNGNATRKASENSSPTIGVQTARSAAIGMAIAVAASLLYL